MSVHSGKTFFLQKDYPPAIKAVREEKKVMSMQEQERKVRRRNYFRWLVIYPVAWVIVSVILYYVTRIN